MQKTVTITGMSCVSCVKGIEESLRAMPGIKQAEVHFATQKANIVFDEEEIDLEIILKQITKLGYQGTYEEQEVEDLSYSQNMKKRFWISALFSLLLMVLAMIEHFVDLPSKIISYNSLVQWGLTTPVIFVNFSFFSSGILTPIRTKRANMDTLIAMGVGFAYLYSIYVTLSYWFEWILHAKGVYFEVAAFLLTFITLGKWLEIKAQGKTTTALKALMGLKPKIATILENGQEKQIPIDQVQIGNHIIVKPGEKIPVDGEIIDGRTAIDESMISGESIPQEKNPGDEVIGATINKTGRIVFEAKKVGKDTFLEQIIDFVQKAQSSKAPIQKLADVISSYFVPIVLLLALLALVIWWMAIGFSFALTIFISVVIIACPCALGLATPTAIIVSTGIGAMRGILIKNAESLQKAATIDIVVFDKTGTLTKSEPKVTDIYPESIDENDLLKMAASIEKNSEHPLADAIVEEAENRSIALDSITNFEATPGRGVSAIYKGKKLILGSIEFLKMQGVELNSSAFEQMRSNGRATVGISIDQKYQGAIGIFDPEKKEARRTIEALKELHISSVMLTGDHEMAAKAVANSVGIEKVIAGVLPKDKAAKIEELKQENRVAMVGDGINDAPALTSADVGIALNAGTDVAMESAGFVLVKDDLLDVAHSIDLARYTMRKIKQNLFWAFFYNCIGIPVAAGVLYPFTGFILHPLIAGAAMALSSICVVLNALSMKRYKKVFSKNKEL